jgi:hypothetical protein
MCGISARQCGVSDFAADTGGKKKKKVQKTTGKTQAWNKGEGEMAPSFFLWNLETAYARVTIKIRLYIIYSISQINIPVAWLSFWHLCGTIFP